VSWLKRSTSFNDPPSRAGRALPWLRALPLVALLVALWVPSIAYIRISTSATDATTVRWDLSESLLVLPNVAGGEVLYEVNSVGSDDIADTSEMDAVEAAFRHWEGIPRSGIAFSRSADSALAVADDDGVNVVYWAEGSKTQVLGSKNFQVTGFIGLTVIVNDTSGPTTGLLTNADIILNGNEFSWTTDPAANPASFDVEEIVTHEVGHVLGLDHTGVLGATMYARVTEGQARRRSLAPDDMAGASSIYADQDHFSGTGTQNGLLNNGFGGNIFAGLVTTLDADGRVLAQAASPANGIYLTAGLEPGSGSTYVEAFDKPGFGAMTLFDETDVGGVHDASVITDFLSTIDLPISITAGANSIQSFTVGNTAPSLHISTIGQRSDTTPAAVVFSTRPTFLLQGDTNVYVGVSGVNINSSMIFEILGTGVTVNGVAATGSANGEPAVVYDVSVDPNAGIGERTIRILFSGERNYATGAIEVMDAATPFTGGIPGLPSVAPGDVAGGTSAVDTIMTSEEPGGIRLTWPADPLAGEYNIWRGDMTTLASGGYNHSPGTGPNNLCGIIGNNMLFITDLGDGGSYYYLVSARNKFGEGSLGLDGSGTPRPAGIPVCP
jgi:hypothetical protein